MRGEGAQQLDQVGMRSRSCAKLNQPDLRAWDKNKPEAKSDITRKATFCCPVKERSSLGPSV